MGSAPQGIGGKLSTATNSLHPSYTLNDCSNPNVLESVLIRGSGTPVYLEYYLTKRWYELAGGLTSQSVNLKEIGRLHGSFDVVFLDFYGVLAKPSDGFVRFMSSLGFSDVGCVVNGFKGVVCNGNYVYTPNVVYSSRYSPYRKYVNGVKNINRFVNRLFKLRDKGIDYLINIDLTVPKDVSLRWSKDKDGVKLLRKAFRLFIKRLENSRNGELGYFYNIHIWSTRTLEPHYHIHMSLCNAVFRDGKFIRFRPYFNVEIIREVWAECLRSVGLDVDDNVDVKVRYCRLKNEAGVVHRVKYAGRHPLVDVASYFYEHEFKGLNEDLRNWYLELIYYINRRVCGGFLRRLKSIVGEVKVSRNCPVCGKAVGRGETVVDADSLISDFVSGSLIIIYWDVRDKRYYMLKSSKCDVEGLLRWFDYYYNDGG